MNMVELKIDYVKVNRIATKNAILTHVDQFNLKKI